jgi:hypothetical protein
MREVHIAGIVSGVDPDDVFAAVTDIERFPELCDDVREVQVEVSETGRQSAWKVKFRGGILEWTERDQPDRAARTISFHQIKGDFKESDGECRSNPLTPCRHDALTPREQDSAAYLSVHLGNLGRAVATSRAVSLTPSSGVDVESRVFNVSAPMASTSIGQFACRLVAFAPSGKLDAETRKFVGPRTLVVGVSAEGRRGGCPDGHLLERVYPHRDAKPRA